MDHKADVLEKIKSKYKRFGKKEFRWTDTVSPITASCIGTLTRRLNDGVVDIEAYRYAYYLYEHDLVKERGRSYTPFSPGIKVIDDFVSGFIRRNTGARILNVACGFCTRYYRVSENFAPVHFNWVDLDLPELINLRKAIDEYKPLGENHNYIAKDILEFADWDCFDLVIAEAFIYHLDLETAKKLVRSCKRFVGNFLGQEEVLSPLQFWKYDPKDWSGFKIKEEYVYDKGNRVLYIENVGNK